MSNIFDAFNNFSGFLDFLFDSTFNFISGFNILSVLFHFGFTVFVALIVINILRDIL